MNPTRKQIVKNDVTYIFRYPTAMDMIKIDLKARELRDGVSDGLSAALQFSQSIAMLNQLCEQPKDMNFGDVEFDILNELASEVTEWIQTFRNPVGQAQGAVGTGEGQQS